MDHYKHDDEGQGLYSTQIEDSEKNEQDDEKTKIRDEEDRNKAIMAIASSILTSRNEAVEFRAQTGIERWWRICEQLTDYSSDLDADVSMLTYAAGNAPLLQSGEVKRSSVVMNIVRSRCEVSIGRFEDILLPVRNKNWGLKVTPDPEIAGMEDNFNPATDDNNHPVVLPGKETPATNDEVFKHVKEQAEESMVKMERVINDDLVECSFVSEERKCIENAVNLGTGILKGPTISKKLQRKWVRSESKDPEDENKIVPIRVLEFKEQSKPVTISVSPWNIYPSPDCQNNPADASYIWEKDTVSPKEVHRMIGLPGYDERQLELVLQEQPKRTSIAVDQRANRMVMNIEQANMGDLYERWEYNGQVKPEYMHALGCQPCDMERPVSARIVFINDRPVKATLNLIDTGDLPYDFFAWSTIPESPWGAGEPIKMMWAQRIINATWRQMMDNAGDSSGANLAIYGLEPDDGIWEITGKKLWKWDGETRIDDIRKAITQVQLTNNQADLQNLLELALKFVDLMTATPTIFQGEIKETPDTLGATNIVVDSSNVTFRGKVKRWDDTITVPHLRRWYDYQMQYHKDDSAKGDFEVDPLGASVLYEKDQMRQQLLQLFALKASDPDVNASTDWKKAIKTFYSLSHMDLYKEPDEQAQQGQVSPEQRRQEAVLQAAQLKSETDLRIEESKQQLAQYEMQWKADQADQERMHKERMKEMDLQIQMMIYSEKRNINLDNIKAELAATAATLQNQRHIKQSIPEIAKPPMEPAGKAPAGQSYQL